MLRRSEARTNSWRQRFHLRDLDRQRYFHYLVRVAKTDEERSKSEGDRTLNTVGDGNEQFQQSQGTIGNVQTQIHQLDERVKSMEINLARVLQRLDQLTAHMG